MIYDFYKELKDAKTVNTFLPYINECDFNWQLSTIPCYCIKNKLEKLMQIENAPILEGR